MTTRAASPEEIAKALGNIQVIAGGYKCRCPGHEDKKASLQINVRGPDGRPTIYCHACGSGSEGRIYDAIEKQTGLHFKDRELPSKAAKKKKQLLIPSPISFPKSKTLPKFGPADIIYEYRNHENQLCMIVGRWDVAAGKEVRPSVCVKINGEARWVWELAGYDNKVLYNTPELVANPDKPVLVVEGEKTADAAKYVLPEYAVVTYQGGAGNWKKSSWALLKGRDIVLWPDNDEPGRQYFYELAKYLNVEGFAKSVKIAYVPRHWPEKWDLADEMPGDLADVTFKDGPEGGEQFYLQNTDLSNYKETFDALYILYYDGKRRYTISKQSLVSLKGRPYDIKKAHLINPNHEAWRSVMTREGPAIQLWADDKMRDNDYVTIDTFLPNGEMIIEQNGEKIINTFTGFTHNPVVTESCDSFKTYLLHILANGDKNAYDYIFNFVSHLFQFPEERPTVALIFKGEQGTGKSFFGRVISDLLGGPFGYAFRSQTVDNIAQKFNAHLHSKLLIWIEELELTKSRSMENRLKSLITDKVISIERKGMDTIQQINLARVMGSTNHEHIWNVNTQERRLSVFEVSEERMQDQVYFKGILTDLEKGGYGRLIYEFLNYPVDHALVNKPFNNVARQKQVLKTPEPARDLAYRLLKEGHIYLRVLDERRETSYFQRIDHKTWYDNPVTLSSKVLRAVIQDMLSKSGYTEQYSPRDKRISARTVARLMGGDGSYTSGRVYVLGDEVVDSCYKIPDLRASRTRFAKEVNIPYEELFPYEEEENANVVRLHPKLDAPF